MLLSLIRYFRGYVVFSVIGKFPERFLNITARNGIILWNPVPNDGKITASMYLCDYKRIRSTARKSRVRTKVEKRCGFPFVINRYRHRKGLFFGAIFGLILCLFLSNFIWSVQISGTENISNTYLSELLSEVGVKTGIWKKGVDVEKAERDIQRKCHDIRWMSINITGSLTTVEVKETYKKPKLDKKKKPCNIKAECDGVITKIKTYNGKNVVTKGSGVVKGQLLVSGLDETKQGALKYVRANAEVFADVTEQMQFSYQKNINYYSVKENSTKRSRIEFLWLDFPCTLSFKNYEKYVTSVSRHSLCINDVILPASVRTQNDRELCVGSAELSRKKVLKKAETDSVLYEIFSKNKSTPIEKQISVNENKNGYICTVNYTFNENIAKQVEFDVTE